MDIFEKVISMGNINESVSSTNDEKYREIVISILKMVKPDYTKDDISKGIESLKLSERKRPDLIKISKNN